MSGPDVRTTEVGGIATRVTSMGAGLGPAVVLLHGGTPGHVPYCGGSHLWGELPTMLARTRRVIAVDGPGSAGTAAGIGPLTVPVMADHAAAAIEALGGGPVHLLGHDLGGLVAATVAMARPDLLASVSIVASAQAAPSGDGVDNLTLLAPPAPPFTRPAQFWCYDRMSYAHHHIDDALLDASVAAGEEEAHRGALRRAADPTAAGALPASITRAKFALFKAAREGLLRVPIQVVLGSHDPLLPRDHGVWLFRIVAASQREAQLHIVNRSGSFPFREQPDAFLTLVTSFQDALARTAAA